MVRKMLLGAVLLVALFAAPAAAQYPFTVTPTEVRPGSLVNIKGSGCAANEQVNVKLTYVESFVGAPVPTVIAEYTTKADAEGAFNYSFEMPADAKPGKYLVEASCGTLVFSDTLTLGEETTPTTTPGSDDGEIVRTGSDLNGLGIAGAAMLGIGGAILLATRSRRHRTA